MENFVRIVMEKTDNIQIDESIWTEQNIYENNNISYVELPLPKELSEEECDEYANRLANYMFEQGHEDFDIEMIHNEEGIDEETYDGDEFFEAYGVMWFNEDDEVDEAEYQGRKVSLGKPMRGDVKKFKVYVRDPKTKNIKKVTLVILT